MQRQTEPTKSDLEWDEKLFLAVCAYLLLKGLISPKNATDRRRVRETYEKVRQGQFSQGFTTNRGGHGLC